MKAKIACSLLVAVCALLLLVIPSEGLLQASAPAPAPRATAGPDPACVKTASTQAFCADPKSANPSQLCAYLPRDSEPPVGYTSFSCSGQVQFDNYSWQTFVALNWPADSQGRPCTQPRQPGCTSTSILTAPVSAPRVWDYFLAANRVIPSLPELQLGAGAPACGARKAAPGEPPVRVLSMIAKADGSIVPDILEPFTTTPLIDRNLNYTIYEIVLNQDEATYITTNHLNTAAGQEMAKVIDFPCGKLAGGKSSQGNSCPGPIGGVGSIEIKAAWRILDPAKGDDLSRYFWREQDIYISRERSTDHKAFCISKAKLGLVALHILHKTASQPEWFWSTFEHVDNAPATSNPASCAGPAASPNLPRYSYYRPECPAGTCQPDVGPPGKTFLWSPKPPYAINYATAGKFGTQVVRCQPIPQNSPSSPILDGRWQPKLANTVWKNYMLVGTQWGIGYTGAPPVPPACYDKNVVCAPPHLLNSVQETYMQRKVSSSNAKYFANGCIQCHALATTVGTNQKPADFSFLLGRVHVPPSPPEKPRAKKP